MGKSTILIVLAIILGSNAALFDSQQTSVATDEKQAERQGQMLAREIARSGHNVALSKARQLQIENPDTPLEDILTMVNGEQGHLTGDYQGGTYTAEVYLTSAATFAVRSVGTFTVNEHEVRSEKEVVGILGEDVLQVSEPSTLQVTFLESMAGYCSAIFLQRIVPNGQGTFDYATPELIFTPGNNRDGAEANYETVLQPGTMMNFILAVDADFNCEKRGQDVEITDDMFNYTRSALREDVEDFGELKEGIYAMIQEKPYHPGVWRIAYEDLVFGESKLNDVKQNSYGNASWDSEAQTYGGSGWHETNTAGYWRLSDYGSIPDFSDQVIEVELLSTNGTTL